MGGRGDPIEGRRSDGQTFPMELLVSEMWLGGTRKFTAAVRDDTERQKLDRMKNEFISTVSHELRTPLTSIGGALGLIEGGLAGEVPEKTAHLISVARANCERLVRLINDILDVEKMESGRMEFQIRSMDLGSVVSKAIEANAAAAAAFDVALMFREPERGVGVEADHDRLMQVLTNLISNAAKYSPPGDTVTVSIGEDGDLVRVTVADNGPGIPAEFHARIFSKFGQADSSDSRAKGGTGLGLHANIGFGITAERGRYRARHRGSAARLDLDRRFGALGHPGRARRCAGATNLARAGPARSTRCRAIGSEHDGRPPGTHPLRRGRTGYPRDRTHGAGDDGRI